MSIKNFMINFVPAEYHTHFEKCVAEAEKLDTPTLSSRLEGMYDSPSIKAQIRLAAFQQVELSRSCRSWARW